MGLRSPAAPAKIESPPEETKGPPMADANDGFKDFPRDSTPSGVGVPSAAKPTATAEKSRAERRPDTPLAASGIRSSLPERPAERDTAPVADALKEARRSLDALFGDQNQKVMELKLQASQGIEAALARLEEETRRTRQLLERNEALAREAERLIAEEQRLENEQDGLESELEKAAERNEALATRGNALREERLRLQAEREELEDAVASEQEELAKARADVERLQQRKESLEEENQQLERFRSRLEENIARLERLRDEYMTAINRLKNTKEELIRLPGEGSPTAGASSEASGA
ncbi:MAG: hypothetical protein D6731_22445 [Planctomycetota bacterium]|nr:MAG: hypothetical protein D6731_22445 [Planctomycetota bacterium]